MPISPHAIILPFKGITPRIAGSALVMAGAVIIGDVVIGENSSIWSNCVLRGDVEPIRIGANSNLQDGTVVHVTEGGQGTHVGDNVTVGHMALLHDCTVETGGFVGMRATLLDYAKVESGGMLAAGSLLASHKIVPAGQIWSGTPAKYWRDITAEEREIFTKSPSEYVELASQHET